jgi:hypothetical protein
MATNIENYQTGWVSEWLLFNTNSAIFHVCHGEIKLIVNEMTMRSSSVLSQRSMFDFYSADSLKQHSAEKHVAPFEHIIFLLNASCLAEKQHIPIA